MSASKKGKKQDVSSSDDGFESYVRDCLQAIRQDIEEIKSNQGKFKEDLQAVKKKLDRTEKSLKDKFEALEGEVHEAMVKFSTLESELDKHAKNVGLLQERLLQMERYSRQYNLRFFNIPEDSSEDCIKKLQSILSDDLGIETSIENAHRIGGPRADDGADPRPIIAKFIYRPERFCVIQKKRDLKNGVRVSEDLIWEDRQKKKKLKDVMKQAYDEGKKPRFRNGNLYIDGVLYKNGS